MFATNLYAQQNETTRASKLQSNPLYQATQQALDTLTRAEIAREEALLIGKDQLLNPVREQCRAAISQLRAIKTQQANLLRESYRQTPASRGKNSWTLRELESLGRNLKVQLARAYRNQAMCYSAGSLDHLNALNIALEQLSDIVTQPLNDTSVWQARIEQVVCLRLLKKHVEARQQIDHWIAASPPAKVISRLAGERLRNDLEQGTLSAALAEVDILVQNDERLAVTVPETDEAILETLLAARLQANPEQSAQFMQQAIRQLKRISTVHGPYWNRRAEVRLGNALAKQADTDDPKLLTYAATSLYAAGKLREAVAAYDRIATLSANQDVADRRFQALKTAAAIKSEMNQREDALARFRKLALDHPQHAEAAHVHLIAIGLAAELSRAAELAQRGERFEHYLALLSEHLKMWHQQPSAKTVEQWLAKTHLPEIELLRAQRLAILGKREQSLTLYRKLVKNSPDNAQLLETFANTLAKGEGKSEWRESLQLWHQIEKRSKPGGRRWSRGRQARLELLDRLGEGEQAERLRQLTKILYPQRINDE